jgi:alpha-D-ribose 1-methylphosphonate 5-triphosphate synthase subunit PhnH
MEPATVGAPALWPAAAAVPAMRPAAAASAAPAAAVEQTSADDDTPAWLRDYSRRQRVARRVRYRAA